MLLRVISPGRFVALAFVLASLCVSACASATQADNAAEFRERASRSGYEVGFVPSDASRPGLVAGVARSEDGLRIKFIFSFGPGPDTLPDRLRNHGARWVDMGDRFEYWIEEAPPGLVGARANRYARMTLALEGIGCRVVADRPCFS